MSAATNVTLGVCLQVRIYISVQAAVATVHELGVFALRSIQLVLLAEDTGKALLSSKHDSAEQ